MLGSSVGDAVGGSVGSAIGLGAGVLGGRAAGRAYSGLPAHLLVAVSDTMVYGLQARTRHSEPEALVFGLPRSAVTATVHQRVNVRVLELIRDDTGARIELEGNRIPLTHSRDVIRADRRPGLDQVVQDDGLIPTGADADGGDRRTRTAPRAGARTPARSPAARRRSGSPQMSSNQPGSSSYTGVAWWKLGLGHRHLVDPLAVDLVRRRRSAPAPARTARRAW